MPDTFETADIEKNKTMAGLAYLIFFLPLITCPESKYAKFHANQALLLFIVAVAGNVILGMIPVIGWMIMPIYAIGILILGILGLINGFGGKAKRLPIFGKYNILK
ncbi:MAG: membrane protein [Peptococcaceae bacterium BICA1-8]|nr:MAG: membrane protein [Peptococcaceae bacterium BICA1-8]